MRKSIELDPLAAAGKGALIFFYAYARQPDRAIEVSKQALEDFLNFYMVYASVGAAYELKHQYAAAIGAYEREMTLAPDDADGLRRAAQAHAMAGDTAQARALLENLLHLHAGTYIPPIDPASIYATLGDKINCLAWLNRGVAERSSMNF